MPLEAVMIIVDNSESSRNGDYMPTRYEAQEDTVNVIFRSVTDGNPESSVGLMSIGGKGPEVLTTLTRDRGKVLDGLHRTKSKIRGTNHLWTGLQVAFLGLKHRQNRSQRQRIVAFVCSPPTPQETRKLDDLALKLKKNNVTIDFVLFGDTDDDETRKTLDAFISKVKGGKPDGAQMIVIPPSSKLLSDQLLGTGVLHGEGGGDIREGGPSSGMGGGNSSGGMNEFGEFDFDPNLEPELALALRMSMEEERARQEKAKKEQDAEQKKQATLEGVAEEEGEEEPLLDRDGKPKEDKEDKDDKNKDGMDGKDGEDKMDMS